MTGTYDADLDTLYWPTGNPGADLSGDERGGDNLYSSSIVALDAKTGKLKWYYQFTPHNVWDWDAEEPPVLVDTAWRGQNRHLLLHADRNGFFYVLDRTDGRLPARQAVREEADLGQRNRRPWSSRAQSEPGAHSRGQQDLPIARRRH